MTSIKTNQQKNKLLLVVLIIGVLLLSLALRLWGLTYDLANVFHPDEPWPLNIAYGMLITGDMNPHFFDWPSLVIYINYFIQLIASWLTGAASNATAPVIFRGMGIAYSEVPALVLAGRLVSVSAGVATVGVVIATGKRLQRGWGLPLLAGTFTAIVYSGVGLSKVITADIYAMFFISLVMLASVDIIQTGKTRTYILAGIALGFTIGSKYNAGLAVISIIAAHFMRNSKDEEKFWCGFKDYRLYLAGVLALTVFVLSTPYALLSFNEFWTAFSSTAQRYASGHVGMEGDSLRFYLIYMWKTGGILYILSLLEVFRAWLVRSKPLIMLSLFPAIYFTFISSFTVRNDRTFLPLTPFAFLLAASFLTFLWQKAHELSRPTRRKFAIAATLLLIALTLIHPLIFTLQTSHIWANATSREEARVWINTNIPTGARIAYESYAPYLDPTTYQLTSLPMLIDQPAAWYIENGYDYFVAGSGMYSRFYNDSSRYPQQVSAYNTLFDSFELVRIFKDGLFEVRVYRVQ